MSPLRIFWLSSAICVSIVGVLSLVWPATVWVFVVIGPLILLGIYDSYQRSHALIRNFPVIGRARYWMEAIRSEIQQYFVESDTSGRPFSRELRSVIYQRAKVATDTRPFGTIRDLYEVGKKHRVFNYHRNTVNSFLEILGAAGLSHPRELRPRHIQRRVSPGKVQDYGRIYRYLEPSALSSSPPGTPPRGGKFHLWGLFRGLGGRQRGAFLTGTTTVDREKCES